MDEKIAGDLRVLKAFRKTGDTEEDAYIFWERRAVLRAEGQIQLPPLAPSKIGFSALSGLPPGNELRFHLTPLAETEQPETGADSWTWLVVGQVFNEREPEPDAKPAEKQFDVVISVHETQHGESIVAGGRIKGTNDWLIPPFWEREHGNVRVQFAKPGFEEIPVNGSLYTAKTGTGPFGKYHTEQYGFDTCFKIAYQNGTLVTNGLVSYPANNSFHALPIDRWTMPAGESLNQSLTIGKGTPKLSRSRSVEPVDLTVNPVERTMDTFVYENKALQPVSVGTLISYTHKIYFGDNGQLAGYLNVATNYVEWYAAYGVPMSTGGYKFDPTRVHRLVNGGTTTTTLIPSTGWTFAKCYRL